MCGVCEREFNIPSYAKFSAFVWLLDSCTVKTPLDLSCISEYKGQHFNVHSWERVVLGETGGQTAVSPLSLFLSPSFDHSDRPGPLCLV